MSRASAAAAAAQAMAAFLALGPAAAAEPGHESRKAIEVGRAERDAGYRAAIETWRAQREAELRADDGWLTLAGLFWLHDGPNSFGSDRDNAIVLPASAPARAGRFDHRAGSTRARIETGVAATCGGRPFHEGELRAGGPSGPPDVLVIGPLSMFVIQRGDRYAIRLRDRLSANRAGFSGLRFFPVDESYRVEARFTPHAEERSLPIPTVLGSVVPMRSPGLVSFVLGGQQLTLEPVFETEDATELFYIFKDATAGRETYGAGRFLYSDPPRDGRLVLDFNKAHSPPCAYTPYATCPLPPKQNVLAVRIEAGEQFAGH